MLTLGLALGATTPAIVHYYEVERYRDTSVRLIHSFIRQELDFDISAELPGNPERMAELRRTIDLFMSFAGLLEFKIWSRGMTPVYAYLTPEAVGVSFPDNEDLAEVFKSGKTIAKLEESHDAHTEALTAIGSFLEIYVPVYQGDEIVGVVEVYRLPPPYHFTGPLLVLVACISAGAYALLYMLLAGTFRKAASELVQYDHALESAHGHLGQSYLSTIRSLIKALELRDLETEGHTERVVALSLELARALAIGHKATVRLLLGAYLHDIGKIGIPDSILLKAGRLTPEERTVMQCHVEKGAEIIQKVDALLEAGAVVMGHHEKWDGSGYPAGLAGTDIPLEARIFALVDVTDALLSKRPYKPALPIEEVMGIIEHDRGTHFDTDVVDALMTLGQEDIQNTLRKANAEDEPREAMQIIENYFTSIPSVQG